MDTLKPLRRPRLESWLSLIGETAGVGGCAVARVGFSVRDLLSNGDESERRVSLQILAEDGSILGASTWSGRPLELSRGSLVDVGYCDNGGTGKQLLAWIEAEGSSTDPFFAVAPGWAASRDLDGDSIEIELVDPRRSAA